jgi:CheY-like chemotaxis protein
MDIQMPEIDGLEATAVIRKQEESTGKHLPIIAMTAHAMQGDRERCFAAGMDGYIAKPIQPQDLRDAIENLRQSSTPADKVTTPRRPGQETIDTAAALARVGGDLELLKEMTALFLTELPQLLTDIRKAVTAGDPQAIERAAHKLKGCVSNFNARPAFEAALKLETLGRNGSLQNAMPLYADLEVEMKHLELEMATLGGTELLPRRP